MLCFESVLFCVHFLDVILNVLPSLHFNSHLYSYFLTRVKCLAFIDHFELILTFNLTQ